MKELIEKIKALPDGDIICSPGDERSVDGFDDDITTDDLKALATSLSKAVEALEHYADELNWGDGYVHTGDWMDGYQPDDCHGYDFALETLSEIRSLIKQEGVDTKTANG